MAAPKISFGTVPKSDVEGQTCASMERGTPMAEVSSGSHAPLPISKSIVREAFDGSVRCLPVSRWMSQESTVPKQISPDCALLR